MKTKIHILSYVVQFFFRKIFMFQTEAVEKVKTYISYSIIFLSKIVPFMGQCEKYCIAGQARVDSMTNARCVLDK
jgi:hypothetical protein